MKVRHQPDYKRKKDKVLRLMGVYLNLKISKCTIVSQETDQFYELFKSVFRENLEAIYISFNIAMKHNRRLQYTKAERMQKRNTRKQLMAGEVPLSNENGRILKKLNCWSCRPKKVDLSDTPLGRVEDNLKQAAASIMSHTSNEKRNSYLERHI